MGARRDTTTLHLHRTDGEVRSHSRPGDETAQMAMLALRFEAQPSVARTTITRDLGPTSVLVYDSQPMSEYTRMRREVEVFAAALVGSGSQDVLGEALRVAAQVEEGPYSPLRVPRVVREHAALTLVGFIGQAPCQVGVALAVLAAGMRSAY